MKTMLQQVTRFACHGYPLRMQVLLICLYVCLLPPLSRRFSGMEQHYYRLLDGGNPLHRRPARLPGWYRSIWQEELCEERLLELEIEMTQALYGSDALVAPIHRDEPAPSLLPEMAHIQQQCAEVEQQTQRLRQRVRQGQQVRLDEIEQVQAQLNALRRRTSSGACEHQNC